MRALIAALLLASPAAADILRNDTAEPGGEIAFYPRLQGEESFRVILDAPAWPSYRICRLYAWIGPDDFNVFLIRIGEATEAGGERALIWQTGEEAYQLLGSREALGVIDLRGEDIVTDARQLRVRFTHAPGFPAPPTIASDADGITPGRNQIQFMMRNGNEFNDFTENLPVEGNNPRPPGDWIVRAQVAPANEVCPADDGPGPLMDAGAPDQGVPHDAALEVDAQPRDAAVEVDARLRDAGPLRDTAAELDAAVDAAAPDATPDVAPNPARDATAPDTGGSDRSLGGFALERISPVAGPIDRNVEVVINGRGFPFGQPITAFLGDTRLLEAQVLSESTITAIVPAGIPVGTYSLVVERADGQVAILPLAYSAVGQGVGVPAEDCGCNLAGRSPSPALFFLLVAGLRIRRRRA